VSGEPAPRPPAPDAVPAHEPEPPAGPPPSRRRGPFRRRRAPGARHGLAWRIGLLAIGVAAGAVLITWLVSVGLVRGAATDEELRTLARQATLLSAAFERSAAAPPANRTALARGLQAERIGVVLVGPDGVPTRAGARVIAAKLPGDLLVRLATGDVFTTSRTVGSRRLLIAARRLDGGGGLALLEPAGQDDGLSRALRRRLSLALAIGLTVAAAAGVVLARRLARPLRQAARAAHVLADGRRDVRLSTDGPAELAELGAAINGLAGALQTSEARQREFLLSVSHELRTPLTSIRGFGEALADGVTAPGEAATAGRVIVGEAARLERLVSDLLELARLGAGEFRASPAPTDVIALLAAAGEVWRARALAHGVQVRVEVPDRRIVTETDPVRLRQIIDGLAENALRVVPAGAPIVLAVATGPPAAAIGPGGAGHPTIAIQVRDGGPGLSPDDLRVAFERSALYERYRGVRRVGTGLGLALVAGLADLLGGRALAGSAPEGGAAFTVLLPWSTPSGPVPGPGEVPPFDPARKPVSDLTPTQPQR